MPYQTSRGTYEHASALGHVPTIGHPLVEETLRRYRLPSSRAQDAAEVKNRLADPADLGGESPQVRWAVATDSSPFEQVVEPAFPSTRILFMQIAAVIVDFQKMSEREGPFADPVAIREAQQASVLAGVLPSSNLTRVDGTDPLVAFRQEVDALFRHSEVEGKALLDILLEVEAERDDLEVPVGSLVVARCPNPECGGVLDNPARDLVAVGRDGATCPVCAQILLPTDVLRAHENFQVHGSNQEACSRVLSVAERLVSLGLIGHLQAKLPSLLPKMAFITDGPLALFGPVAPLKRRLLRRLQRISEIQSKGSYGVPIVMGLEKSGAFAEHGEAIKDHIPEGGLMILDDEYIEQYITFRGSPHGVDTYYGRHFFYRSLTGALFTMTVPPLAEVGLSPHDQFRSEDYPTLRASCEVLDHIGTRLYENATIPVALAHEYAAYPLEAAGQVLKLHAEDQLGSAVPAAVEA